MKGASLCFRQGICNFKNWLIVYSANHILQHSGQKESHKILQLVMMKSCSSHINQRNNWLWKLFVYVPRIRLFFLVRFSHEDCSDTRYPLHYLQCSIAISILLVSNCSMAISGVLNTKLSKAPMIHDLRGVRSSKKTEISTIEKEYMEYSYVWLE